MNKRFDTRQRIATARNGKRATHSSALRRKSLPLIQLEDDVHLERLAAETCWKRINSEHLLRRGEDGFVHYGVSG